MKKLIIIKYPPDFDGELHIECETQHGGYNKDVITSYKFTFEHVVYPHGHGGNSNGPPEWETLVEAAHAILAQDLRRIGKPLNLS